jgi:dTDP-4-amino-4,6-dideoxygalactose transaminase
VEIAYADALRGQPARVCPRRTVTPPNRLDTTNRELLVALASSRHGHRLERLRERLRDRTGRAHVFFAPSCRSAIAQILSLLPQHEVVMPAFTCPVVKDAVDLARKRIVYVDCAPGSLNATSAEFAAEARPGRILLPTHLFGLPTDVEAICALARERGCVTVEDAAAAFGARRGGRLLGTFADFGVFSFERSKRLPAFRGAAIVVNNEGLVDPRALDAQRLVTTSDGLPLRELLRSLVYNAATTPWVYGRFTVHRLLASHRARSNDDERESSCLAGDGVYYRREFHDYQADLVLRALARWDATRAHVSRLVAVYRRIFEGTDVRTFLGAECDEAALLRFPVVLPGRQRREILLRALSEGLYLETNYERPLPDPSEAGRYPNAVSAADNMILLPLYRRLSIVAAERMARQLVSISKEAPVATAA